MSPETSAERVPLPGSERQLPAGATRLGDADANDTVTVSVLVRSRTEGAPPPPTVLDNALETRQRQRAAYAAAYGASDADLAAVAHFAHEHNLTVVDSDAARRTVTLQGTVATMSEAFGVTLSRYAVGSTQFRGREGHVHLPPALTDIVTAVLGLDDRPQAHAHFVKGAPLPDEEVPEPHVDAIERVGALAFAKKAGKAVPLWATHVAQLYDFPTEDAQGKPLDGKGQCIAIIELGGGYTDADLKAYFTKAGLPHPTVSSVAVGGGRNQPGTEADGEVLLDLEVSGSIAPGAELVVYFGDGRTDRGFLDALTTAVHDQKYAPSVISISWGGPEGAWTAQAAREFDRALADASRLGVTVCVASGDHGAGDAAGDGTAHADFPAASPHVVACGGTTLVGAAGGIVSEVVWNDKNGWAGGGGISGFFPVPAYQSSLTMPASLSGGGPGRGVPDVAGNADLTSGYIVRVDGQWSPVGGTSAVAPLYAGLAALLNQALGRPVGQLTPDLYAAGAAGAFRDITTGTTSTPTTAKFGPAVKGYRAGHGWDACTGLGSINGSALLAALASAKKPAGVPG